jgi:hypothetical protein
VLDRLLRGRLWVALIALLLTGIVFLNVSLLELNSGIARSDARLADLKRENAGLRLRVAQLGASERIQAAAAARGFVPAAPGKVTYLRPSRGDAARAAQALESWRPPEPAGPGGAAAGTGGAALLAAGPSPPAALGASTPGAPGAPVGRASGAAGERVARRATPASRLSGATLRYASGGRAGRWGATLRQGAAARSSVP